MPRINLRESFEKASTNNLPLLSMFAVCKFINEQIKFTSVEGRGVKLTKATRQSYGDQSVGFVQLRRTDDLVEIYARVTPEHKVNQPPYEVYTSLKEKDDEIIEAKCMDCPASEGGCKHIVAFLFWLHRRSEEPSPTEVVAYWKKSALSSVGEKKFITLREFSGSSYVECPTSSSSFLENVRKACEENGVSNMITSMSTTGKEDMLSLHVLFFHYAKQSHHTTASGFIAFAATNMTQALCEESSRITETQSNSRLWHELRYGRITASTIYEAAHCQTEDGSLVAKILGAPTFQSPAMKRGISIESAVLKKVSEHIKCQLKKCGLLLLRKHPIFGASPDAVGPDFVVEVKCPMTEKSKKNYISASGEVAKKFKAQINLQMYFYKVKKGLFVVAEPDFEKSGRFIFTWVARDDMLVQDLLMKAREFWGRCIFKCFT